MRRLLLAALALAAAASLAGGAVGDDNGTAPRYHTHTWAIPFLEGVRENTVASMSLLNQGDGNLTLTVNASAGEWFSVEPLEVTNITLTPASEDANDTGFFAHLNFQLNLTAGMVPPANATLNFSIEVVAWDGNLTPGNRWQNLSVPVLFEAPHLALAVNLSATAFTLDVRPGATGIDCQTVNLANQGNLYFTANMRVEFGAEVPDGFRASPASLNRAMGYGISPRDIPLCVMASPRTAAGIYPARLVAEAIEWEGEGPPPEVIAEVNLTLEVLPYSRPSLRLTNPFREVKTAQPFSLEFEVVNDGNAQDEIALDLTNRGELERAGFKLAPLPAAVLLAPGESVAMWFNGTAPDGYGEYFAFNVSASGLHGGERTAFQVVYVEGPWWAEVIDWLEDIKEELSDSPELSIISGFFILTIVATVTLLVKAARQQRD